MGKAFYALEKYVMEVKKIVCPEKPFAIGLRLGAQAAKSSHPSTLLSFQKWLEEKNCYVFTINGFPTEIFMEKSKRTSLSTRLEHP